MTKKQNNYTKYHPKIKAEDKYDFSRLGIEKDSVLAKKWGISRERVRQLRKKKELKEINSINFKRSNSFDRNLINNKILEFLKKNKDKKITLDDLHKYLSGKYYFITKKYVKDLGKSIDVDVLFKSEIEFQHCYTTYRKGCRCLICTTCHTVEYTLKHKLKIKCRIPDIDRYINNYFYLYELDTTKGHKIFYNFMIKELGLGKKGTENHEEFN